MPISDVVNLSISVSGAGPTRAGFGEPLIAAYNTPFSTGVREYGSVAAMAADGFTTNHPAYLCASAVFAQSPAPQAVKVARRSLAYTQTIKLTCLSTSAADTYNFQLRLAGGAWHALAIASTGVPATDVATINTAVTGLGLTGLTATHATTILTLTMAAGSMLDVRPDMAHMSLADTTADPGIATDLAAILAQDNAWYGLLLDCQSPAEIAAAEVWAEANGKLFVWNTSDTACGDPASTTDVMYTSKAAAYARSAGMFLANTLLSYAAAAWVGRLFPTDAGSENWAFKTLATVTVDALTDTQIHAVENKNGSVYTTLGGLNLTQFGKQPGGEWIDVTRGTDALRSDLQSAIIGMQANSLKVPFTDAGADMYRSTIGGVLTQYTEVGFLADSPPFFISIPKVAAVSSANKVARNLPNVSFSAELAGAINSTTINGVLTA